MSDALCTLMVLTLMSASIAGVGGLLTMVSSDDQGERNAAMLIFLVSALVVATCIVSLVQWPTLPQAIHAAMPEAVR